jgi:hypothetical protein
MLAIGSRFALIGSEAVAAADRARVLRRLEASGRTVIEIGFDALEAFAGNVLELRGADGAGVLVLSARARRGLSVDRFDALAACVECVVEVPVERIEQASGGSVRCMLAEVFLPPRQGGR